MGRKRDPKPRQLTVIRYQTPDGRRCTRSTPGAIRVKTTTDSYYLTLPPREKGGRRDRIALETADLQLAWEKVRQILKDRREEELGILSDAGRQAARPIAEHLEEWLAAVAAGDVSAGRVELLRTRVTKLIEVAGWRRIGDMRVSTLEPALAAIQAEAGTGRGSAAGGGGRGAQTRNHYLSHARQFARWLVADRRLAADPLARARRVSVARDRRHDRRCPEDGEVRVLFDHLEGRQVNCAPKVRRDMSGPQRALAYMVAMCSGLRAGAVRRLTRESFDLATGDVSIPASSDKARRRRASPLPRWLCDKLRAWLEAGGQLWGRLDARSPGEVLQADLARARRGWLAEAEGEARAAREASDVCRYEVQTQHGPLYLDFHALRHWYITRIASTDGISPATLQSLSGHSDPRLTLGVYSHARSDARRAAVEQLPDLSGG